MLAAALDARGIDARPDQLRMESQHFLDIGRVRVERLVQRLAGQDVRLEERVEVVHDTLAHSPLGIAHAHDRPGADLPARDAARIGGGVFLSHAGPGQVSALPSGSRA
jgi:hypothetical protein